MKKLFFLAVILTAAMFGFSSCQYENPALEESDNELVEGMNDCNMLLGKSKSAVKSYFTKEGWKDGSEMEIGIGDLTAQTFFKTDDNILMNVAAVFSKKGHAYLFLITFQPDAEGTDLQDFKTFKEAFTTFGSSIKLSTKEELPFYAFFNSNDVKSATDYQSALKVFDSSTNGFMSCWGNIDPDSVDPTKLEEGNYQMVGFMCDLDDYRSFNAQIIILSDKAK